MRTWRCAGPGFTTTSAWVGLSIVSIASIALGQASSGDPFPDVSHTSEYDARDAPEQSPLEEEVDEYEMPLPESPQDTPPLAADGTEQNSWEQYTPDQANYTSFQYKAIRGYNTAHDPDGVGWIDREDWEEWDGTVYNPSLMSPADFVAAICPSVDRIRGIREVFYAHNPYADIVNPTKAEIDNWHMIAINHVRALIGYTGADRQASNDHCMSARALWGNQRKFTTQWDVQYPGNFNSAYGPCIDEDGNRGGNAHCGASFLPDVADQLPYLPDGHPGCRAVAGSEGMLGSKANIPWSLKWSRLLCNTLHAEGFWGGHVGPFFHREKMGWNFWDNDPDGHHGNSASVRCKWTGRRMPNLYCNPRDADCDPNRTSYPTSAPSTAAPTVPPTVPPPTAADACADGTGTMELVFRQTMPFVQATESWLSHNPTEPENPNFSILSTMESFRKPDGSFEFSMSWPSTEIVNHWSQSSSPLVTGVTGYEAISVGSTNNRWGGMERSTGPTLLDGSVGHNNWWYAIGSASTHNNGIPGPNSMAVPVTELRACRAYVGPPTNAPPPTSPTFPPPTPAPTTLEPTVTPYCRACGMVDVGEGYCPNAYVELGRWCGVGCVEPPTEGAAACMALARADERCVDTTTISYGKGRRNGRCMCDTTVACVAVPSNGYNGYDRYQSIATPPPTTSAPINTPPTTSEPTNTPPTTSEPTNTPPSTSEPTNTPPTTSEPTNTPPTTPSPTTSGPTNTPPTTPEPTNTPPTTSEPTNTPPTTSEPTNTPPTTPSPTTSEPTNTPPTTPEPTNTPPTTSEPTNTPPTTAPPTTGDPVGCTNNHERCGFWADLGYCIGDHDLYMTAECALACHRCEGHATPPLNTNPQPVTTTATPPTSSPPTTSPPTTSSPTAPLCHVQRTGRPDGNREASRPQQCVADSTVAAVRCCSTTDPRTPGYTGWIQRSTACPWGESDMFAAGFTACETGTFAEAQAICEGAGTRLCTADEFLVGGQACLRGTGCGHDNRYVWTSTAGVLPGAALAANNEGSADINSIATTTTDEPATAATTAAANPNESDVSGSGSASDSDDSGSDGGVIAVVIIGILCIIGALGTIIYVRQQRETTKQLGAGSQLESVNYRHNSNPNAGPDRNESYAAANAGPDAASSRPLSVC